MEFFIIGENGEKFGPADLATLNQWIGDGRVLPTTTVERSSDGVRGLASQVPGLNFGPPSSAVMDVPPAGYGAAPSGSIPTAGMQTAYPRQTYNFDPNVVPPEINGGFNWGAFFFTWIWGLNHKAYITLITLGITITSYVVNFATRASGSTPASLLSSVFFFFLSLGFAIYLGATGNRLAWKSGRFQTVEHFRQVQKVWAYWALGFFVCGCGLGMLAVMVPVMVAARAAALRH